MLIRNSPLRCELLDHDAALAGFADAWRRLCDACPTSTPFQRPEWLLSWVRCLGPVQPWVIAVHDDQQLLGLAPLFVDQRPAPEGPLRMLGFLGADVSDYLDVLIRPGHERAVLDAMFGVLAAERARWDGCELHQIRPWTSPLTNFELPDGWALQVIGRHVSPSLPLPSRVDELDRSVPPRHLRRFHTYRRRAARAGELRLERATPETCARLLDSLITLHQARWRSRGQRGCLAERRIRQFHHEVARAFAARDALALYALHLDDRVIACLYGFEQHGCLYCYLGGFDPESAALSPGVLMIGMVLEESIRRGLVRCDLLRGNEAYKYWWGAEDRTTVNLRLATTKRSLPAPCPPGVAID